jgi:hypothetical protein
MLPALRRLPELHGHLHGLGQRSGWLMRFYRRSGQPPLAKRTGEARTPAGRPVTVIRA